MNKIKIRLTTPEQITEFINICSKYDCDINLYDGSTVIDAKSIIGVFSFPQGKELEVQAITSDEDTIIRFSKDMERLEDKYE